MADMRRCLGSATFAIEAHEAPVEDFPVQPSQPDGLGRMCKEHWTEYTRALSKARRARQTAASPSPKPVSAKPAIRPVPKPAKKRGRRRMTPAMARKAAGARSVSDGTVPRTIRESVDASFGRERAAELARTVEAGKAADEEATTA